MRKPLLTIALFFSFQLIFSQQDSLLRHFKFRNIDYRQINIGIGGGSQYYSQELGIGVNKNTNSSGGFSLNYYQLRSTDKILLNFSGGLGTDFSRSKQITNGDKNRSFYVNPQLHIRNQWFFRNFFTELGADVSTTFSGGTSTIKNPESDNKTHNSDRSYAITLGIGKGRLENVTSMQNALWLSKALEENERLFRKLSIEELNGLGQIIAIANNTRVLDARKRTQFILESIDGYLQKQGLVSKNDVRYFSNLNDILFFAFNTPRFSGTETFVRITPALTDYGYNSITKPVESKDESESENLSAKLTAGINRYIPVNLRHQDNFGIAALLNYVSAKNSFRNFLSGNMTYEYVSKGDLKQAGITAFYEHAIYPNTRTIINFRLDSQGGYQDFGETSFFGSADLSGAMNYFISYRTYFNLNLGMIYRDNFYDMGRAIVLIPRTLRFYISAGLQVSI